MDGGTTDRITRSRLLPHPRGMLPSPGARSLDLGRGRTTRGRFPGFRFSLLPGLPMRSTDSSSRSAIPAAQWLLPVSSPVTVAGAAPVSHRLPRRVASSRLRLDVHAPDPGLPVRRWVRITTTSRLSKRGPRRREPTYVVGSVARTYLRPCPRPSRTGSERLFAAGTTAGHRRADRRHGEPGRGPHDHHRNQSCRHPIRPPEDHPRPPLRC